MPLKWRDVLFGALGVVGTILITYVLDSLVEARVTDATTRAEKNVITSFLEQTTGKVTDNIATLAVLKKEVERLTARTEKALEDANSTIASAKSSSEQAEQAAQNATTAKKSAEKAEEIFKETNTKLEAVQRRAEKIDNVLNAGEELQQQLNSSIQSAFSSKISDNALNAIKSLPDRVGELSKEISLVPSRISFERGSCRQTRAAAAHDAKRVGRPTTDLFCNKDEYAIGVSVWGSDGSVSVRCCKMGIVEKSP